MSSWCLFPLHLSVGSCMGSSVRKVTVQLWCTRDGHNRRNATLTTCLPWSHFTTWLLKQRQHHTIDQLPWLNWVDFVCMPWSQCSSPKVNCTAGYTFALCGVFHLPWHRTPDTRHLQAKGPLQQDYAGLQQTTHICQETFVRSQLNFSEIDCFYVNHIWEVSEM